MCRPVHCRLVPPRPRTAHSYMLVAISYSGPVKGSAALRAQCVRLPCPSNERRLVPKSIAAASLSNSSHAALLWGRAQLLPLRSLRPLPSRHTCWLHPRPVRSCVGRPRQLSVLLPRGRWFSCTLLCVASALGSTHNFLGLLCCCARTQGHGRLLCKWLPTHAPFLLPQKFTPPRKSV